ncbi:MAG: hypothetical protein AAF799_47035 [Myxococcota bacterium]
MIRVVAARSLISMATLAAVACAPAEPDPADESLEGLWVERVTYAQDWVWDESAVDLTEEGFLLTTDLGYEVEVELAWLTTYTVALVPCPEPVEDEPFAALGRWLLPAAHAGHGGDLDPSAMDQAFVDDFSAPQVTTLGTVEHPAARYCRVHLLSAAAPEGARGTAPADAQGSTLLLEGRARAPGAAEWTDISVDTSLANGVFVDLPSSLAIDGSMAVTLHRRLDTLLNGIEWSFDSQAQIERQLLLNLMADVSLDATSVDP